MEGKYGVILCSHCKKAKIIELEKKTTSCAHCNKKLRISKLKIHFQTNDQQKARNVIGLIHANQDRRKDEFITIFKENK